VLCFPVNIFLSHNLQNNLEGTNGKAHLGVHGAALDIKI
jgi:hypothetical protein